MPKLNVRFLILDALHAVMQLRYSPGCGAHPIIAVQGHYALPISNIPIHNTKKPVIPRAMLMNDPRCHCGVNQRRPSLTDINKTGSTYLLSVYPLSAYTPVLYC